MRAEGAEPAFKGYHGYRRPCGVSANEQVVHGIPSKRPLVEGDLLSIDMGAKLDGFFGDCAVTVPIGRVSPEATELLRVTEEALFHGIEAVSRALGSRTSGRRSSSRSRPTGSRSCASSSGTASGPRSTRSRRSRTTAQAAAGRDWPREWSWRSSRW